ncbi:MAG TPA: Ig-like domain-containing protein, partial [Acidobacteriota bacterium]|nr:Ig-like domain-containing protein [Acidobacteriota bacterium]
MKRWIPVGLLLLAVATIPASLPAQEPAEATAITVEPSSLTLEVGEKAQLSATVTDAAGNVIEAPVIYFSRARRNVGVNGTGELEAYRPGAFDIVALVPKPGVAFSRRDLSDSVSATIRVTVPDPPLAAVEFVEPPTAFYADTRLRLQTRVTDASVAERGDIALRFSSSDPSIAEINALGTATLKTPGNVTLTVTADNLSSDLTARVMANATASLQLEASALEARTGDVIHVTASPRDGDGNAINGLPVQFAFQSRNVEYGL